MGMTNSGMHVASVHDFYSSRRSIEKIRRAGASIHTYYYHGHRCTHIAWDFVVFILHGYLLSLFALSTLLSSHSHHIVTPIINVIRTTHRGNHIVKQLYHLCSCQVHKGTTTTQPPHRARVKNRHRQRQRQHHTSKTRTQYESGGEERPMTNSTETKEERR